MLLRARRGTHTADGDDRQRLASSISRRQSSRNGSTPSSTIASATALASSDGSEASGKGPKIDNLDARRRIGRALARFSASFSVKHTET